MSYLRIYGFLVSRAARGGGAPVSEAIIMMIDGHGVRILTARGLAAWFVQALLWFRRGRLVCRSCGMEIVPEGVMDFIESGCPACEGRKLEVRRE
jgi:hypothetical protein